MPRSLPGVGVSVAGESERGLPMSRQVSGMWWSLVAVAVAVILVSAGPTKTVSADPDQGITGVLFKGLPIDEFLSGGGMAALFGANTSSQTYQSGAHGNGRTADKLADCILSI